jgi:hypothetical protein
LSFGVRINAGFEARGNEVDEPATQVIDVIFVTKPFREIVQPSVLGEGSEHGGNNQMQVPVEICFVGFWVGSLKFPDEIFREFSEKALVHLLDETGGFGKTAGNKLG